MSRTDRFTTALAGVTMGVYALLLVGATTAVTDAAAACGTWPACDGRWFGLTSPDLAVVWAHRTAAAVVGLAVLAVAVTAWRRVADRRVRAGLLVACLLYPLQVALGATAATTGVAAPVGALHLATGLAIFASLVTALAWHLEHEDPAGGDATGSVDPAAVATDGDTLPFSGRLRLAVAYLRLTKPRLMWLLCLVAAAGMALAAETTPPLRTVALTLGGGVLAIGASGTFNHVLERDVDREMARTSDRPVVQELISVRNAVAFGGVLTVASLLVFLQVNTLAAALGMGAIAFYTVGYTLLLKPNTVQNTVLGGFAGALPALIGSAAVTGEIGLAGVGLALVIFLWTPAHFYNLALAYKEDYERGGFPMLPVVRGEAVTRKHVLLYLGATFVATATLGWLTELGLVYAGAAAALGTVFLWAVVRLHRERDRGAALRAFHASNAYLGAVLLAVVVDSVVV